MNSSWQKNFRLGGIVAGIFFIFFLILPARAITISPTRQTIVVDPGKEQTVRFTIENPGQEFLTVTPTVDAFSLDEKTGRPLFGVTDVATTWVTPADRSFVLRPKQRAEIPFDVVIPVDAEPGAHYLGLFVQVKASNAEGAIGVASRIGSILFLHVGGEVVEEVQRESFTAVRVWNFTTPIEAELRLKNNGSIHAIPVGKVEVSTQFGGVREVLPLNAAQRKILPGAVWSETYMIPHLRWRDTGPITLTASMEYGLNKKIIIDRVQVWYLPWKLVVTIGAGFFLIGIFILIMRKRKKSL